MVLEIFCVMFFTFQTIYVLTVLYLLLEKLLSSGLIFQIFERPSIHPQDLILLSIGKTSSNVKSKEFLTLPPLLPLSTLLARQFGH